MKRLALLLLPLFGAVSCVNGQDSTGTSEGTEQEQTKGNLVVLDVKTYNDSINGGNVTLIDVRTPGEFAEGKIEGAKNINVNDDDFNAQISGYDKSEPIYVYCRSGARSAKASSILIGMGFEQVYDLSGGIMSWIANGKPVTQE